MKTCPKCGTSLDDDKKKCYMCGADLMVNTNPFGESFDTQLGATITNNQDNVYNNMGQNISDAMNMNPNNGYNNGMNNMPMGGIGMNQGMNMNPSMPNNPMVGGPMSNNPMTNMGMGASNNFNDAINHQDDYNSNVANSGADYFNNTSSGTPNEDNSGLNGLNSMQYDNRTALEKIFSGNKRFKSKDELNADLAVKKGQAQPQSMSMPNMNNNMNTNQGIMGANPMINNNMNTNYTKSPANNRQMNFTKPPVNNQPQGVPDNPINQFMNSRPNQQFLSNENQPNQNKKSFFKKKKEPETEQDLFNRLVGPKEEEKVKAPKKKKQNINWSKELDEVKPTTKMKNNPFQKSGAYLSMALNIGIFVLFVIGIFAVYFIFFRGDDVSNFGGLTYTIDDKFVLKNEDSNARYYTYGDNCAIQIKYGTADQEIGFINNYFESVKEQYKAEDGYLTQTETINIDDNNWSSLSILQLAPNPAEDGGTQTIVKYKYVSIIYKNNYYQIVYANTDNNNECSAMYDYMIDSLEFEEEDR